MRYLLLALLGMGLFIPFVHARPVSYPSGWTFITENNGDANSALIHYSPTAFTSVGVRTEYRRDGEYFLNSVQMNNLLKRWNKKDSQANLYLKSGVGVAVSDADATDGDSSATAFTGIAADWETRRYFVSYENRYIEAGDLDDFFVQRARIGIAPYVADYGSIHTWLMLEVEHEPEDSDGKFTVTPLIRLFKGASLLEAGMSNEGEVLFNFTHRF
jgi:hypothetical protein